MINMDALKIALIFILVASTTSGDVRTSNTYYSGGSTVHANVALHNTEYTNNVNIFPDWLVGQSWGDSVNDTEPSWFEDKTTIDSVDCKIGTNLGVQAIDAGYSKNFAAGSTGSLMNSYNIEDGQAETHCFNQVTSVNEVVTIENNHYHANLATSPQGVYSEGYGESEEDISSSFSHEMYLTHMGKWSNINSELVCSEIRSGEIPVRYTWNTFVHSNPSYAADGLDIKVDDGNRDVWFFITGSSSMLPDKRAGPIHLPPIRNTWFRESDEIYMNFELIG